VDWLGPYFRPVHRFGVSIKSVSLHDLSASQGFDSDNSTIQRTSTAAAKEKNASALVARSALTDETQKQGRLVCGGRVWIVDPHASQHSAARISTL
jgi:hypothetical protein